MLRGAGERPAPNGKEGVSERLEREAEPATPRGAGAEQGRRDRRSSHLGFVAHEVRNPLSTALWSAELLARISPAERGGARGEKLALMCLRALSRLRLLVEDHFLSERLEAGAVPQHAEALLLSDLVEGGAERLARGATVASDLEPGLTAFADRNLVERLLGAVLAASSRDGAAVQVVGRGEKAAAVLRVRGAPPLVDALADPLRGSPSDPLGQALALPTARRAAEAVGGSLQVEGGDYLIRLPQARGDAPPAGG
jgi:K+-sensing histidine kinase KdpD